MHCRIRWAALALALLAALPTFAADDKKPPAKADPKGKLDNQDKEKYVPIGQLAGKLLSVSSEQMTLRVTYRYAEPNPQAQVNFLQQQQNLMRRQLQALQNPNPLQRQQQLMQVMIDIARFQQQGGWNLFTIKEQHKDIELRPVDDLKVRTLQPPLQFDDKGNPKKYTAQELKELKGDEKLPGYTGDRESLQANQTVMVVVVRPKPAPGGKKDGPEDGLADDKKPLVRMVVVLAEPPPQ